MVIIDNGREGKALQGKVITYPENPSTQYFYAAAPPQTFQKYDFVRFSDGIGIVEEVEHYGFVYPFDVFYEESEALGKEMVVSLYRVRVLCDMERNSVRTPPLPGTPVSKVTEEDLKVLGGSGGIHVGYVGDTLVPFYFDPDHLIQRHFAILAMSGAGKSYLTKRLLDQLINGPLPIPVVVFDHHGEYGGFAEKYPGNVFKLDTFKMDFRTLPYVLPMIVPDLTPLQQRLVQKSVKAAGSWEEAVDNIKKLAAQFGEKTQKSLEFKLDELKEFDMVGDRVLFNEEWNYRGMAIVQLKDMPERKRRLVVALLSAYLFEQRKENHVPPMLLVVEEAHNYVNTGKSAEFPSRVVLERIAREGRKFGMGLAIISQRPRYLSKTVLAQLNTFFLMRMTNPSDLQVVKESCEQASEFLGEFLTNLKTGEGIVVSEALPFPVLFKTGPVPPEVAKSFSQNISQMWEDWNKKDDIMDYLS